MPPKGVITKFWLEFSILSQNFSELRSDMQTVTLKDLQEISVREVNSCLIIKI